MIVPFSSSYRLHTREHYNALTLVFGADQVPRWRSLAAKLCGRPLMIGAAFNATAAGIGSLLRTRGAAVSASLVVEYVVDLVFRLLLEQVEGAPSRLPEAGLDWNESEHWWKSIWMNMTTRQHTLPLPWACPVARCTKPSAITASHPQTSSSRSGWNMRAVTYCAMGGTRRV